MPIWLDMGKITTIFLLLHLLISTSCKQQTDNSHSQDERINQAAEETTDQAPIEETNDQAPTEETNDQVTTEETTDNNNTEDQEVTTFSEAEGNVLTTQSQNIINTYCISCHGNFPKTNEEWIANSRVTPGDPENSNLIKRMKVCSTGSSANMPKNSNQVTDEDCQILNLWIEYLYQLENETL